MLNPHQLARVLMWLGSIVCFAIFWQAGQWFDLPMPRGYSPSLLAGSAGLAQCIVTVAVFALCCATGTIIAGTVRYEAGLVCAAIGLSAISMRGGPIRFVLLESSGASIYLTLAGELVLLYAIVAAAWMLLRQMRGTMWLTDDPSHDHRAEHDEPIDQKLLAIAAQVVVGIILMMLLCQSDAKAQCLGSVFIASYLGALAAHQFVAIRPSAWFWIGPLIVGLLGYVAAYINPTGLQVADVRGLFAGLARPVPLDYASAGPAGAILGYWTSLRWHRTKHEPEQTTVAAQ